jgi:hypothetical protein
VTEDDLRKQASDFFEMQAGQRMATFNFYIALASLLSGGLGAAVTAKSGFALLSPLLGLLLLLLSFIFWKLDQRNSDLVKSAENVLKYFEGAVALENEGEKPHLAKRFLREEADSLEKKRARTWRVWKNYYSYSDCFGAVFLSFGSLGAIGAVYAMVYA